MNIWGKMMVSAGGAVLATMLVGGVGLFGMEKIHGAIDSQAAVSGLLKQHMAADLSRAKLVNQIERALRIGRMKRDEGPAVIDSVKVDVQALLGNLTEQAPPALPAELGQSLMTEHGAMKAFAADAASLAELAFSDNYKANQNLDPFLA